MREIVLDTETTGLDPKSGHRIINIACVEVLDKIKTGKIFHTYVNPERDVPYEAYCIHKISTEFLVSKPKFKDVAKEFMEFIKDSTLVIHNATFDVKFLNHELGLVGYEHITMDRVVDTLPMARAKFPGAPASLDALCRRFSINLSDRKLKGHGALLDSELLYEVYIRLKDGVQSALDLHQNQKTQTIFDKDTKQQTAARSFSYPEDSKENKEFISKLRA